MAVILGLFKPVVAQPCSGILRIVKKADGAFLYINVKSREADTLYTFFKLGEGLLSSYIWKKTQVSAIASGEEARDLGVARNQSLLSPWAVAF